MIIVLIYLLCICFVVILWQFYEIKNVKKHNEILHRMLEETAQREEIGRKIIKELRERESRRK